MNDPIKKKSLFWDKSVDINGHTGYGDQLLHRYDQPIRLAILKKIIAKLFENGLRNKTVLDIGCGTGDFVAISANLGAEVFGMDISQKVLERALKRFAENKHIKLQCGTVIDLVTQEEKYDLITSVTVLQHHVDDEEFEAAMIALRSALKPNGYIVLLELVPPIEKVDRQYGQGVLYLVERPAHVWHSTFEAAGLRVVKSPVFPQLGISCLRGIDRLASSCMGYLKRNNKTVLQEKTLTVDNNIEVNKQNISYFRRLRRKSLALLKVMILLVCYPFDHWLMLPFPSKRFRTYGIFILKKK